MIRLVGGSKPSEGRIEVKWNNQWGTMCDDFYGIADGRVICKYLGYPSLYSGHRRASRFGPGSGPVWFDNMHCKESDYGPFSCRMSAIGMNDCTHNEDAGIECNRKFQ